MFIIYTVKCTEMGLGKLSFSIFFFFFLWYGFSKASWLTKKEPLQGMKSELRIYKKKNDNHSWQSQMQSLKAHVK